MASAGVIARSGGRLKPIQPKTRWSPATRDAARRSGGEKRPWRRRALDRRAARPHRLLALCERFPPRLPPLVPVVADGGGFGTTGPRAIEAG